MKRLLMVAAILACCALLLLLSSWTFGTALAAEVRCSSVVGHYFLPQDEEWFKRRWPSGVRPTKSTCALGFIYGPITPGDYEKVRAFYRQNHPFLDSFSLASSGENLMEAIKIGRFFRQYLIQANAIVFEPECLSGQKCMCASACALIWFGAVNRSGSVGLHRPRINPSLKSLDLKETAEAYGLVLNNTRQYLNEMEVPNSVIEAMMATDFEDLIWVNADREGLKRSPSFAELADANCGILSEKDKELLSRRFSSPKTPEELIVERRLRLCPTELLSRQRDKLLPP